MNMMKSREIVGKTIITDTGVANEFFLSVGGLLIYSDDNTVREGKVSNDMGDWKPRQPIVRSNSICSIAGKTVPVLPFEMVNNRQYVELRVLARLFNGSVSRSGDTVYILTADRVFKLEDIEEIDGRELLCIEEKRVQDMLGMTYNSKLSKFTM